MSRIVRVRKNAFFGDIDRDALGTVIVRRASELETVSDSPSGQLLRYPIIDKNVPESLVKTAILELKSGGKGEHSSSMGFAFHYLLAGQISYQIGGETYELEVGDSLYFDTQQVHFFYNNTVETAQLLVVSFIV